jgi:hypothetical protein
VVVKVSWRVASQMAPPNSALLSDAFGSLRYAYGAAKRER